MRGERSDLLLIAALAGAGLVDTIADQHSWFWSAVGVAALWWLVSTTRRLMGVLDLGPSKSIEYRHLSDDDLRDLADAYRQAADNLDRLR